MQCKNKSIRNNIYNKKPKKFQLVFFQECCLLQLLFEKKDVFRDINQVLLNILNKLINNFFYLILLLKYYIPHLY